MSLGCGCGCKGKGGKGSCMDVTASFPPIGGVVPMAFMGGYPGIGMSGLGDTTTCISFDANGNCLDTMTTPDAGVSVATTNDPAIQTSIPVFAPTPIANNTPIPINTTTTPASSISPVEAQLASAWTNIFGSILKSEAGANPTYQAIGPNGTSTTIYGSLPASLQSSLATPVAGGLNVGTLLAFAGVGLVLFMIAKK